MALLHRAIFRATCLATPFLQTFSHCETSRFTGVTLSNVSCNLSRFDDHDHIGLKEHFHWLVPQTVGTQAAGQMLHFPKLKKFVATVAESRTQFYFPQRFLPLISRRFLPLQGMLHCAMVRATCLAMALRDKLHQKLHSVTAP